MSKVPFTSPYYPYEKVQTGFNSFRGAERIPLQVLKYLLDLPDEHGYVPKDDNRLPRARLAKYLWHDGANPLGERLPTPAEKLSLLFDGEHPVLDSNELKAVHPKGYRLYPLEYWGQDQLEATTTVKCFIDRVIPKTPFLAQIGIRFHILVNANRENTTRTDAYSRAYAMEQCILEALDGVNITGVGTVEFNRLAHMDDGSRAVADEGNNVGRNLHLSLQWADSEPEGGQAV